MIINFIILVYYHLSNDFLIIYNKISNDAKLNLIDLIEKLGLIFQSGKYKPQCNKIHP